MYEMVILCFLTRAPMHGYLIAKIINDMIGPYARLSNGRLYPLLSKLEAEGLIVAVDSGAETRADRRHRAYEITATGRKRFHQLMMDTTSNPGDYQRIFWYKLPFLEYLNPVSGSFCSTTSSISVRPISSTCATRWKTSCARQQPIRSCKR